MRGREELETTTAPFFLLSGVNHRSAAVELRERLAVPDDQRTRNVLGDALSIPEVDEAVVVSTCNRVELLVAGRGSAVNSLETKMEDLFASLSGVPRKSLSGTMYHYADRDAVQHLFRVAAGLDSMVLGEPQVLGQVKTAYRLAQSSGATKTLLNRLFHRAFGVAKLVRTKTKLGRYAVSMCYASRQIAEQIFGDLHETTLMLLGAGEMGSLALKHFAAAGVKEVFIVNKTYERAIDLARLVGGVPLTFSQISHFLPQSDIIVGACTVPPGSPALIDRDAAQRAAKARAGRPQFYIDLAVPRNLDSAIDQLDGSFLYNVDDLESIVRKNQEGREQEVAHAEIIVGEEVERFFDWVGRRDYERSLADLAASLDEVRAREVGKTIRRLTREGVVAAETDAVKQALDDLAQSLVAKVLHRPLSAVRSNSAEDASLADAFRRLFSPERAALERDGGGALDDEEDSSDEEGGGGV